MGNSADTSYELCIMRHGIAVPRGPAFPSDDDRPLTSEGQQRLREIARGLDRIGYKPQWIISSPLTRARQTGAIVAEILMSTPLLDETEALSPGGSLEKLLQLLNRHPERSRTLVVGHETDLSEMAARLMGASRHARLSFKKGGCCLIRFDDVPISPPGELIWWLTPRVLRQAAKSPDAS